MSRLMFIHAPGGPALDYALPKLRAVADLTVLPLVPLPPFALTVAAELGVPVADPVPLRGAALIDYVVDQARADGITGLIALAEFAQLTVARAAERLGLRGSGPNVMRARDKLEMRSVWEAAGLPNPRFRPVADASELAEIVEAFREPVLLKSRTSSGSIGQIVVTGPEMAASAWADAQHAISRARELDRVDPQPEADSALMMAETLIPSSTRSWYDVPGYGDYLSVEGIVVDGLYHPICITGRLPTIAPFTELSNQAPCVLAEPLQRLIEDQSRRAVDALGLQTCGTHTEIKLLDDNGLCLLETAARLGGAMVTREVETVFGIDLISELARALLGEPVRLPTKMLISGDCAAASVALIATDSQGKPWRGLPNFDPERIEQSKLFSPGSRAEVIAGQSIAADTPMPLYDVASGVLNFAGLLFLRADDPAVLLRDTYALLDGLEEVLTPPHDPAVRLGSGPVTADEVVELFRVAELNGPLDDLARMQRMLDESQQVVVARAPDGTLVGLIRVLTDFSFNAFIADLAVRPKWQQQGVGRRLVEAATAQHPGVKFVVQPGHDSGSFWSKVGFEPAPTCMVRSRQG